MKVLKFGGTSVGTVEALRNVKYIVEHQEEPVVVVVSALGGLTDTLIKAANLAAKNDIAAYRIVQDITSRHSEIMNNLIEGEEIDDALNRVRALFYELSNAYTDISQSEELTESDIEEIVSYGERLSSLIISQIIENATKKGEEKYEAMMEEARSEVKDMKIVAEQDIEQAKQDALNDIRKEMVNVALTASKEILKREVDKDDNTRLAEDFINRLN